MQSAVEQAKHTRREAVAGLGAGMRVPDESRSTPRLTGHSLGAVRLGATAPRLQPKLTIGAPDDPLEREADRIADQVMRMPESKVQRACACGGTCAECRKKETEVRRQPIGGGLTRPSAPRIVHEVLASPGRPLEPGTRRFMESRLGHDLSSVRIHADSRAAESADAVAAEAYTVGSTIAFGRGQYAPETLIGRRLLAHELAHVLQQSRSDTLRRQDGDPQENALDCESDPIERIEDAYRAFVAGGRLKGMTEAADLLENFLNGAPKDEIILPATFVLRDADTLRKRRFLMASVLDKAFDKAQLNRESDKDCGKKFTVVHEASRPVHTGQTKSVWYAMGRFDLKLRSEIELWKGCDKYGRFLSFSVAARDSFSIDDKYDWHPGLKVTIPFFGEVDDRCAKRLQDEAGASTFMMRVTWEEQQAFVIEKDEEGLTLTDPDGAFPPAPVEKKPLKEAPKPEHHQSDTEKNEQQGGGR